MHRNRSPRHRRAMMKAMPSGPVVIEYEIIDPMHRPDMRGEFAGVKVATRQGKQIVALSAKAARFYLDQGAIRPLLQDNNNMSAQGPGGRGGAGDPVRPQAQIGQVRPSDPLRPAIPPRTVPRQV